MTCSGYYRIMINRYSYEFIYVPLRIIEVVNYLISFMKLCVQMALLWCCLFRPTRTGAQLQAYLRWKRVVDHSHTLLRQSVHDQFRSPRGLRLLVKDANKASSLV
jgi:hypothetical protein